MIGRWYDPIGRCWRTPRAPRIEPQAPTVETETDKGYRMARENRIWEALVATAQASQHQESAS
jgi:hypothetical protein